MPVRCRSKLIYELLISPWCSCRSKLTYELPISLRASRLWPCVNIISLRSYPCLLHTAFIANFRAELGVSGPKSYFALGTMREAHSFTFQSINHVRRWLRYRAIVAPHRLI